MGERLLDRHLLELFGRTKAERAPGRRENNGFDRTRAVPVEAIIEMKYRAEMPAFTPGNRPSDADRQRRMEIMQKQSAEIRSVLTDDQRKTFDKNIEEMRNRRPRGGRGRTLD